MNYQMTKAYNVRFIKHHKNKVEVQWSLDGDHSCVLWAHPHGNRWFWSLSAITPFTPAEFDDFSLNQLRPMMPSLSEESLGWFWFEMKIRAGATPMPQFGSPDPGIREYEFILF